ncbi:MAG: hypothetical protein ACK5MV_07625 [Aminipila sp.]
MSIIKSLQSYLQTYEGMEQIKDIKTYVAEATNGYALSPTGNSKVSEDILGNKIFTNQYVFIAKEHALDEINRGDKQDFLEDFSDWLEEQNSIDNLPQLQGKFKALEIAVSNGMLLDIEEAGTGVYQVQFNLRIKKEVTT